MAVSMYEKCSVIRAEIKDMLGRHPQDSSSLSLKEAKQIIQLLVADRIELEMQKEALCDGRAEAEESCRRYKELYDFAPVPYITFNEQGLIEEANLATGILLGIDHRCLTGTSFSAYLSCSSSTFLSHLAQVFRTKTTATCEITLRRKDGSLFSAKLESNGFIADGCRRMRSVVTEWAAPSATEVREFIEHEELIRPDLGELLDDCEAFQHRGILNRPEDTARH